MSDAEIGYNSLYSNITEKAQAVISKLREELKTALEKGESSRTHALEEAQTLVKAADSAREETVARTVHSYERLVSQLRSQLDNQTNSAAVQLETLQREVMERIRCVSYMFSACGDPSGVSY
jgi:arginine utilization protein RocB